MTRVTRTWAPLAISLFALFAAVGGVGWAGSLISGKKIKKNSIPLNRLTKSARRSLAGKQGPIGPRGLQGSPGPFVDVVPSGKTLVGAYAVRYQAAAGDENHVGAISFGFKFSPAPTPHFIMQGSVPPPECPGNGLNPQATPGNLCIYETAQSNRNTPIVFDVNYDPGVVSPFGAIVFVASTGAGQGQTVGSWAATAS